MAISLVLMSAYSISATETKKPDCVNDSLSALEGNWVRQLYACNFRINDPRIKYPKFVDFCRQVYNWGDYTFNSYNPSYVTGTGRNWKLYVTNYNWIQNYAYLFHDSPVLLHTKIYSNFGLTLNFMAVSVGYSWNMNRLFSENTDYRKTFTFSFTCSLFSAELLYRKSNGKIHLTKFGNYKDEHGDSPHLTLNGTKDETLSVNTYYFFNNRKYSQAAAYSYSKYQQKSAGSWILGLTYNRQKISMDFSELPESIRQEIPEFGDYYDFQYSDYAIMGGYGYNCVLPHKWLYNITILPSLGYKRSYFIDMDNGIKHGSENNVCANFHSKMSLTYNYRAFFVSTLLRFDGGVYLDNDYTFFNSMASASVIAGVRF